MKKTFYITTPIYYINDKPHIGHAYTTVSADIFARYHRMMLGADNVHFLTGTDEHGNKIHQAAKKLDMEPQDFADRMSAVFSTTWDRLSISNNDFIRTTQPRHKEYVIDVLNRMKVAKTPKGNDVLFEGVYEGLYCTACEAFKTESELDEQGNCLDHRTKPEILKETNWFFRMSDYEDKLRELITRDHLLITPESRKNEVIGLLDSGLRDLAISRPSVTWGIPLPWDKDQTAYVWVDALSNYISALGGESSEMYKKFWPADVHLMSKDIVKFHTLIWPSILLSIGIPVPLRVISHGFMTVDGQKMSKTIGNVIDPNDLVDLFGTDATRYLLVSQFGFGTDGDISLDRFNEMYNARLAGGLGNLVSRVTSMVEKYFSGEVPSSNNGDDIFEVADSWKDYQAAIEGFRPDEALKAVWLLIDKANKYVDDQKPWALAKENPEALGNVLYNLLEAIRQIALMLLPFMPDTSKLIFEVLGLDFAKEEQRPLGDLVVWAGLPSGVIINKGTSLFPRLEIKSE